MLLVIREYLSMLKESKELDSLIPTLLFSMNITVLSKAQIGHRQNGVDISAIGIDPTDKIEKVFLFVIKQGDITRNDWTGSPQSISSSLDDIFQVYLTSIIDKKYKDKIKKIILCTGGDLIPTVYNNWEGYGKLKKSKKIQFDFWGGDKLSQLINEYLLDEYLFPNSLQKKLRKTLALLDDTDYNMKDFYEMIEEIIPSKKLTQRNNIKFLRLLNLCLNILFYWAEDSGILKKAFWASERAMLKTWKWYSSHFNKNDNKILLEIAQINATRSKICFSYFNRIQASLTIKDGLAFPNGYAESMEYNLTVFEQIGLVSLVGLDYYYLYNPKIKDNEMNNIAFQSAHYVAKSLSDLIKNNNISFQPSLDRHINDINLAMLLFYYTNNDKFALYWLRFLFDRITWKYKRYKFFPLFDDSIDSLMDVVVEGKDCDVNSSTLLYNLLEWSVIFNDKNMYDDMIFTIKETFPKLSLQIWYPDNEIEDSLYDKNSLTVCGTTFTSKIFDLDLDFDSFKLHMKEQYNKFETPLELSFVKFGFPIIGLIASNHYNTPVMAFYWRSLLKDIN